MNPLGRCVKRWVGPHVNGNVPPANTTPATFLYYDGWNLIQEGLSGGTPDRVYVHGGRTDEIVASWAGGDWSQHQYDAQGNCILLTDTNGLIHEQYDYDAFGFPYVYDRWGNYIGGLPGRNRFLFTGREWIKELRLYDYRARLYQPELGRFLQPDPTGFSAGDYNLYRYCHNDPVNKSDPTGLVVTDDTWQRQMLWQGGGDGTVSEQLADMQAQSQQAAGNGGARMSRASTHAGGGGRAMGSDSSLGGYGGGEANSGAPSTDPDQAVKVASNGKLSPAEANGHWRSGRGVPIVVSASKYNFSRVKRAGFNPATRRQTYTFPRGSRDWRVLGTVTLQENRGGQSFRVLSDTYDFEMHPWGESPVRNVATIGARALAGEGTSFKIIFLGNIELH